MASNGPTVLASTTDPTSAARGVVAEGLDCKAFTGRPKGSLEGPAETGSG